ncbi:MAG: polysaccharide biosynthesis/export family protein [Luteolibacter sp.]
MIENNTRNAIDSTSVIPGPFAPRGRTGFTLGWCRFETVLAGILSMVLVLVSTGCGNNESTSIPAEAYVSKPSSLLAAGDEINVAFSGAPELNQKQKIQANGKVSMPTVGDVSAAGKSITSLQTELTSLYQPHLQDPTVIISMEAAASGVYVSGEVLKPGKYPLDRPMTALEAIMEAGGFTKLANPKQVIIVRNQGGRNQRYVVNMNDALTGLNSNPFYLRSYDMIYVKQSNW